MQEGWDVEGDADAIYARTGFDPEEPPAIGRLCLALTGFPPELAKIRNEGRCCRVGDDWRVFIRRGLPKERAVYITGHELAEWWFIHIGYCEHDVEERCDALGAALVAPRRAFRRATEALGHSAKKLAAAFRAPEQLALLRIGEVTGRPVALVRPTPIVRGDDFAWPTGPALARALRRPPASAHPVRVGGEWGMMASRAAWPVSA